MIHLISTVLEGWKGWKNGRNNGRNNGGNNSGRSGRAAQTTNAYNNMQLGTFQVNDWPTLCDVLRRGVFA